MSGTAVGIISIFVTLAGAVTGAVAARLWYRASRTKFKVVGTMREGAAAEALNDLAQWIFEIKDEGEVSSRMNSRAARWTAYSVGLNVLAALLGQWPTLVAVAGSIRWPIGN
jgi:hypothetical protein